LWLLDEVGFNGKGVIVADREDSRRCLEYWSSWALLS